MESKIKEQRNSKNKYQESLKNFRNRIYSSIYMEINNQNNIEDIIEYIKGTSI